MALVNPIIWGEGSAPPEAPQILKPMFIENGASMIITDVITGGENYEPQS